MASDARNTRVVIFLVVAMTAGAAMLRLLETPTRAFANRDARLTAERGPRIDSVVIEYAAPGAAFDAADYDCVVPVHGRPIWTPKSTHVRLLVEGSAADTLPHEQCLALLGVLGSLHQQYGLNLSRVNLDPSCDPRVAAGLAAQARDLFDLLVRKSIVR